MPDDLPEPEEVLAIHDEIEQEYDLTYTGAAVAAPRLSIQQLLEEVAEYEGVYYRAAALLRDLITSHLFEDGNKRTAWATTVLYLQDHDEAPAAADDLAHVEHVLKRIRRFDVDESRAGYKPATSTRSVSHHDDCGCEDSSRLPEK